MVPTWAATPGSASIFAGAGQVTGLGGGMTLGRRFLLILMLSGVGLFAWLHANARADPIVRTARIGFRDWPAGVKPVRVLLASDVHLGNLTMDVARLRRIVGQIDRLNPDVVLLAGDFVAGHTKAVARNVAIDIGAPLAELHAPLGVFAVLGNHDYSTEPALVAAALRRANITVLENSAARAGPLAIAGIADISSQRGGQSIQDPIRTAAAAAQIGGVPVALTHGDDRDYLQGRIRLLLDGHTHCGQIDLTRYGVHNPYVRILHGCGIVRDKDGITLTTAGLGTSILPLRLNAPPDIWLITLGPAAR